MVVRRGVETSVVMAFADWRQQHDLAMEEAAAAALAEAEPERLAA
jgi:hypothetical protein